MVDNNSQDKINADKQQKTAVPGRPFPPGVSGNPAGRPKRKTLTELIHAKLDDTPGAWDAIVNTVIQKVIKDKEKEIIKTFWQYTDGMPKQDIKHDLDGGITVTIRDYGANNNTPAETKGSSTKE